MAMSRHILKLLILSKIILSNIFYTYANNTEILSTDDITIKSDRLIITRDNSVSNFIGNVVVYYGDLIIKTDNIIVEFIENAGTRNISKLLMPKHINVIKQNSDEILIADKATYDNKTKKIILQGNIYMQFEDRVAKCNELVYDMPYHR